MIDSFLNIDRQIFLWINTVATHPWLDVFFAHLTDLHKQAVTLIPILAVIAFFSIRKFRKSSWRVFLGVALAIACSDLISYRVLKKYVDRPRPFQSQELAGKARVLTHASGNSFPSNHAANCFSAAAVLSVCFPAASYFIYIIAALVGYSRIYLGVHYPSDVLAGAAIGFLIGKTVAIFTVIQFKNWTGPEI